MQDQRVQNLGFLKATTEKNNKFLKNIIEKTIKVQKKRGETYGI